MNIEATPGSDYPMELNRNGMSYLSRRSEDKMVGDSVDTSNAEGLKR